MLEVFVSSKFVESGNDGFDIFKEIAPTTDDIWFWAAAVANGTYILPFPLVKHNKPRGLKNRKTYH